MQYGIFRLFVLLLLAMVSVLGSGGMDGIAMTVLHTNSVRNESNEILKLPPRLVVVKYNSSDVTIMINTTRIPEKLREIDWKVCQPYPSYPTSIRVSNGMAMVMSGWCGGHYSSASFFIIAAGADRKNLSRYVPYSHVPMCNYTTGGTYYVSPSLVLEESGDGYAVYSYSDRYWANCGNPTTGSGTLVVWNESGTWVAASFGSEGGFGADISATSYIGLLNRTGKI